MSFKLSCPINCQVTQLTVIRDDLPTVDVPNVSNPGTTYFQKTLS